MPAPARAAELLKELGVRIAARELGSLDGRGGGGEVAAIQLCLDERAEDPAGTGRICVAASSAAPALAALPAGAAGSTVSTTTETESIGKTASFFTTVRFVAAAGERNRVSVASVGADLILRDAAGITPGPGCARVAPADLTIAACRAANTSLRAELGDGDDEFAVALDREADDALIIGGAGDDVLTGGDEPDTFDAGSRADESDTIKGGEGKPDECPTPTAARR